MSLFKFRENPFWSSRMCLDTKREARGLTSSFIIECITITPSQLPLQTISIMSFSNHCISGPFVTADILTRHIKEYKCIKFSNPSLQKPFFQKKYERFSAVLRPEAGSGPPSSTRSRFHCSTSFLMPFDHILLCSSSCLEGEALRSVVMISACITWQRTIVCHTESCRADKSSGEQSRILGVFQQGCKLDHAALCVAVSQLWRRPKMPESHNSFIPELF